LVAGGASPEAVFAAVTKEVCRVLPVEFAVLGRDDHDGSGTIVACSSGLGERFPVGSRWTPTGKNLTTIVLERGSSARIDGYADASGEVGLAAREAGVHSSVGTPIVVEGQPWGVVIAGSSGDAPLPPDTEARLASFTELVATAIANAESHAQLVASRARIVAAADETRRQIERDLHDGTQQRLVSLGLQLRAAEATVPTGSTPRSCPRAGWSLPSRHFAVGRPCRSRSTCAPIDDCPSRLRSPSTTSCQKH
jgi:GAF domain-containing protein